MLGYLLLTSCGRGYEVGQLYTQKIKNSEKSIVEYLAWSTLNDGSRHGYAILEKNEARGVGEIEDEDFRVLAKMPENDSIIVIGHIEGGNRIPKYKSTSIYKYKGLIVKRYNYEYSGGPFNLTYYFSECKESNDTLFILNIKEDLFALPTLKNELAFCKGNIKLVESYEEKGVLKEIEVYAFVLSSFDNSIIEKQTILKQKPFYEDGLVRFIFTPTKKIKISEFSDFGFYKKREIKDRKIVQ